MSEFSPFKSVFLVDDNTVRLSEAVSSVTAASVATMKAALEGHDDIDKYSEHALAFCLSMATGNEQDFGSPAPAPKGSCGVHFKYTEIDFEDLPAPGEKILASCMDVGEQALVATPGTPPVVRALRKVQSGETLSLQVLVDGTWNTVAEGRLVQGKWGPEEQDWAATDSEFFSAFSITEHTLFSPFPRPPDYEKMDEQAFYRESDSPGGGPPFHHEKQTEGKCGIHAMNAMLGGRVLTTSALTKSNEKTLVDTGALDPKESPMRYSPKAVAYGGADGNDPEQLLALARRLAVDEPLDSPFHLLRNQHSTLDDLESLGEDEALTRCVVGKSNPAHFVAFRRDSEGQWWKVDSMQETQVKQSPHEYGQTLHGQDKVHVIVDTPMTFVSFAKAKEAFATVDVDALGPLVTKANEAVQGLPAKVQRWLCDLKQETRFWLLHQLIRDGNVNALQRLGTEISKSPPGTFPPASETKAVEAMLRFYAYESGHVPNP